MWIMGAELFLVFLVIVMLLHEGMRIETGVPLWALLILFHKRTHLSVEVTVSLSILSIVVIHAVLVVVRLGDVAGSHLEDVQIEVLNDRAGTLTMGAVWNW